MATLFDRKVNRGNIEPITSVVNGIATKYRLTALNQIARYEKEIVQGLKYREDFLADKSLKQPAEIKATPPAPVENPHPTEPPAEETLPMQVLRVALPDILEILFPLTHL